MSNESRPRPGTNEYDELFRKEIYTPEEAADLAGVSLDFIYQAAHRGTLKTFMVGQDVVSIKRSDLIDWMKVR